MLVGRGTVLGFAGSIVLTRVLSSPTTEMASAFGASSGDPLLPIGVPLLPAGLAMLACYLPARKAPQVDPLAALRQE